MGCQNYSLAKLYCLVARIFCINFGSIKVFKESREQNGLLGVWSSDGILLFAKFAVKAKGTWQKELDKHSNEQTNRPTNEPINNRVPETLNIKL
jgi:hypothetical protein